MARSKNDSPIGPMLFRGMTATSEAAATSEQPPNAGAGDAVADNVAAAPVDVTPSASGETSASMTSKAQNLPPAARYAPGFQSELWAAQRQIEDELDALSRSAADRVRSSPAFRAYVEAYGFNPAPKSGEDARVHYDVQTTKGMSDAGDPASKRVNMGLIVGSLFGVSGVLHRFSEKTRVDERRHQQALSAVSAEIAEQRARASAAPEEVLTPVRANGGEAAVGLVPDRADPVYANAGDAAVVVVLPVPTTARPPGTGDADADELHVGPAAGSAGQPLAGQSPDLTESPKRGAPVRLAARKVQAILSDLPEGNAVFSTPKQGSLGRPIPIRLLVSLEKTAAELAREFAGHEPVHAARIKVTNELKAELSGGDFKITSLGPARQLIASQESAEWRWDAVPTRSGLCRLYLTITLILPTESGGGERLFKSFERQIDIEVSAPNALLSWLLANGQSVGAILGIPAAVVTVLAFLHEKKRRRRRGAGESTAEATGSDGRRDHRPRGRPGRSGRANRDTEG